jgi:hypothetical protein
MLEKSVIRKNNAETAQTIYLRILAVNLFCLINKMTQSGAVPGLLFSTTNEDGLFGVQPRYALSSLQTHSFHRTYRRYVTKTFAEGVGQVDNTKH